MAQISSTTPLITFFHQVCPWGVCVGPSVYAKRCCINILTSESHSPIFVMINFRGYCTPKEQQLLIDCTAVLYDVDLTDQASLVRYLMTLEGLCRRLLAYNTVRSRLSAPPRLPTRCSPSEYPYRGRVFRVGLHEFDNWHLNLFKTYVAHRAVFCDGLKMTRHTGHRSSVRVSGHEL